MLPPATGEPGLLRLRVRSAHGLWRRPDDGARVHRDKRLLLGRRPRCPRVCVLPWTCSTAIGAATAVPRAATATASPTIAASTNSTPSYCAAAIAGAVASISIATSTIAASTDSTAACSTATITRALTPSAIAAAAILPPYRALRRSPTSAAAAAAAAAAALATFTTAAAFATSA